LVLLVAHTKIFKGKIADSKLIVRDTLKRPVGGTAGGPKLARKVVRVYLSPQQKSILERICQLLGTNESEALRLALVNYAEKLRLIKG